MKKRIAICCLAAAAVLAGMWLLFRPRALGKINGSCAEAETSVSNFSFSGKADEKIKIRFVSDVKSGDLNIFLYDSDEQIIYELDTAKELVTYYTFSRTDTYILAAEYTDFVGNFQVEVYPAK